MTPVEEEIDDPGGGISRAEDRQGSHDPADSAAPMYTLESDTPLPVPIRSKRRQVKNACTNCQRACKKCDDARPCLRCVTYGIADKCVDSQRKSRKKGTRRGPYKKRDDKDTSDNEDSIPQPPSEGASEGSSPHWQPTPPFEGTYMGPHSYTAPSHYGPYPVPSGSTRPENSIPYFPSPYSAAPPADSSQNYSSGQVYAMYTPYFQYNPYTLQNWTSEQPQGNSPVADTDLENQD